MHNKKIPLSWLITGITLAIYSIVVLLYTLINRRCQIGPAICGGERFGAYIGIFLSIVAFIITFIHSRKENQLEKASQSNKGYYILFVLGPLLIVTGIIMIIAGLLNPSSSGLSAAMMRLAMVILAIPTALAGATITGLGAVYGLIKQKNPNKIIHPIMTSIFIIGITTMILFIFF